MLIICLLILLSSCNSTKEQPVALTPVASIYQAVVPQEWKVTFPEETTDTTKPICELLIDNKVRITVHKFPALFLEERVPNVAQIERWQRQFPEENAVNELSHDGFYGLVFVGKKNDEMTIAWTMHLDDYLFQKLCSLKNPPQESLASYTIKATGKICDIEKYRDEIATFEKSFHLIIPIPL